jgi:cell division protein FtsN
VTAKNKHIGVHRVPARTDAGRVSRLLLVAVMAAGVIASVWIAQSMRPPEPRTSIASDELGTLSPPLGKIGEAGECSDGDAAEVDSDSGDGSAAEEAEEQQQEDDEQEQLQQQEALDQQQLDESMQEAEEQNEEAQQQATQDQVQAQESDPQVIQDAQQG